VGLLLIYRDGEDAPQIESLQFLNFCLQNFLSAACLFKRFAHDVVVILREKRRAGSPVENAPLLSQNELDAD
jgi:hypothetical protein